MSSAFYPEISPRSFRATELAKEFCRQGHDVTVISEYREHEYSDFINEFPLRIEMWNKHILPEVPNCTLKPFSYFTRTFSRLLLVLFEYPVIEYMFKVKRILKNSSRYDLMISFAVPYPVHWGVAWALSSENNIAKTWIADCGDPFMGNVLDSFRKPFYFKFLEKWFCRKADFITIPIEGARSAYYEEFHNKIRVIPQGFDFDLDQRSNKEPYNDIPTFAYAGGFIPGVRDPRPLLDFLLNLDLRFKFLMFTKNHNLVREYFLMLDGKLIISGYVPRDELIKILSGMDFLINFDNNTSLNSPSKLIDYALANRPVLNIKKKFSGDDLLDFIKGDYSKQMMLPDPKKYHISNISRKFLSLMDKHRSL